VKSAPPPFAALALALLLVPPAAAQSPSPRPVTVVSSLTLFAGTDEGFYRSGDWGRTWQPRQHVVDGASGGKEPFGAMRSVLPIGPRVYAGGDQGLAISDDFGDTWRTLDVGAPVLAVLPSRYPQSDPTIFVGTPTGLLKSADDGRTTQPTALSGAAVHRLEWPGPALVVATSKGVRVSENAAGSFATPSAEAPAGPVRALALSSFFAVDPVFFAGVGSDGVLRSPDGGKSWLPAGLDGQTVTDLVWLGPFLYAVSDRGVFRTEDLGKTWTPLNEGLKDVIPARILFPLAPAAGAEAFLATDRGVYHTPDGGQHWALVGLAGQRVVCLGTFPPPSPLGKRR
jgi:photosystem II stability/assembly factor-like uncharacterized protein